MSMIVGVVDREGISEVILSAKDLKGESRGSTTFVGVCRASLVAQQVTELMMTV